MAMVALAADPISPQFMTLEEAEKYAVRNVKFVPIPESSVLKANRIACIDGRRRKGPEHLVGFPGAGVGVIGAVCCAVNVGLLNELRHRGEEYYARGVELFGFDRLVGFFESEHVLGGVSGHTDDMNAHHESACAGCGHIRAMLEPDSRYGLGAYRSSFGQYTRDLKRRHQHGDSRVIIDQYSGRHEESAVFIMNCSPQTTGHYLSMPPNDGCASVFIVNRVVGRAILRSICHAFVAEFRKDLRAVGMCLDAEELLAPMIAIFNTHLRRSASILACGMPVYLVNPVKGHQVEVKASDMEFGTAC